RAGSGFSSSSALRGFRGEWERGANRGSCAQPRFDLDRAPKASYALLHSEQSHPARALGVKAAAIVGNPHANGVAGLFQLHDGILRVSVAVGAVERLPHDAIHAKFQSVG